MEKPLFLPWKTTNKKVTKARFFFLFFLPLPLSILVDLLWPLGKIFLAKSIVGLSTQLIHVRTKEKKPKSILSVLGVFWHHQVLLSHIIVLVATIFRSRHRLIFFTCDTIHFSSFFSFGQVSPEWNGGGGGRRRKEGGPNGKRKEEEEGAQRKGGEEEERRHFSVQNLEWSQVRTGKKHYTITSFESKHIIHFPTLHSAFLFFHQPIFWSFFVCPLSLPRLRPQQAPFIVKGCGRCGVAIKGGGGPTWLLSTPPPPPSVGTLGKAEAKPPSSSPSSGGGSNLVTTKLPRRRAGESKRRHEGKRSKENGSRREKVLRRRDLNLQNAVWYAAAEY